MLGLRGVSRQVIDEILCAADGFVDGAECLSNVDILKGKTLLSAFYQPSTRTRMSHETAMLRLGGNTMGFADPKTTRAGDFYQESIKDTVQMLHNYADIIVMRHYNKGAPHEAARWSRIPIINAGDGWGEHPTQVLTDLFTIKKRLGGIDGLNFLLIGDGRMRTMHSICYALSNYDVNVSFVCPEELIIPASYLSEFADAGLRISFFNDVSESLNSADVIYMEPIVQADYAASRQERGETTPSTPDAFKINRNKLDSFAKKSAIVLHSFPRMDELSTDVDDTRYAAYWDESMLGVPLKMALLMLILG